MKKIILSIIIFAGFSLSGNSQVVIGGNGTTAPQANANLEIIKSATGPNGILIPRLTVKYLDDNKALYGADQDGILVFVTDGSGTGATTDKIKAPGFYVYTYGATGSKWLNMDPATYGSGSFKPTAVTIPITTGTDWNNWETGDYKKYNYFEFTGTASFANTKLHLPDPAKWADRTIYIRNHTSGTIKYIDDWNSFYSGSGSITKSRFARIYLAAAHQFYSDGKRWFLMGGGGSGSLNN